MSLTPAQAKEAANELQAMVDAVRDDAPAWRAILLSVFGSERPTLGACRRAFSDTSVAATFRRPVESAIGANLRVVDDLAEAFSEIVTGAADGNNGALRHAQAVATALVSRILVPA